MTELVTIVARAASALDLAVTASWALAGVGAALTGAGVWGIVRSRRAGAR